MTGRSVVVGTSRLVTVVTLLGTNVAVTNSKAFVIGDVSVMVSVMVEETIEVDRAGIVVVVGVELAMTKVLVDVVVGTFVVNRRNSVITSGYKSLSTDCRSFVCSANGVLVEKKPALSFSGTGWQLKPTIERTKSRHQYFPTCKPKIPTVIKRAVM